MNHNDTNIDDGWAQKHLKTEGGIHEIEGQTEVTKVLKEIAEEEIDEVDIIMEDITDEIKDLQQSITSNFDKKIEGKPTFTVNNVTEKNELSKPFGEKIIPLYENIDIYN